MLYLLVMEWSSVSAYLTPTYLHVKHLVLYNSDLHFWYWVTDFCCNSAAHAYVWSKNSCKILSIMSFSCTAKNGVSYILLLFINLGVEDLYLTVKECQRSLLFLQVIIWQSFYFPVCILISTGNLWILLWILRLWLKS